MADYRIICTIRDEDGAIGSIGINQYDGDEGYDFIWTVAEARTAIEDGHRLYTKSPSTGKEADVEPYEDTIRTKPDDSTDNNLDNLPACG